MKKALLAIITLLFVFAPMAVSAQTALKLTAAPAKQEIVLNPGESDNFNVRFYNNSDTPVSGTLDVVDFIVKDKEGSPVFIEETSDASYARFAASRWVTLPYNRMTIAAEDKVAVPIRITVPGNARPGGRYISIFFETAGNSLQRNNTDKEAGSSVTHRVAALVFVRVAGNIIEKALLGRISAPIFFEYGPINVETEILNKGDYHIAPQGVVTLTNMFGGLVDQTSLEDQNIFPDTARIFRNILGNKWMAGRYKINLAASYGELGQALNGYTYIWVFPWKVTLMILLALTILYLLGRNLYTKIVVKETALEHEIGEEKEEIEKLREELKKRKE
jgi:hypothetical protein